jgi:virulence-associated protein VapD
MDPEEEKQRQEVLAKVQKLRDSKFKQQTLPAWRPIPSFRSTMITFTVFGIIFLGLGILLYVMSDQIREEVVGSYDDDPVCKPKPLGSECTFPLEIKEKIVAPVYVYYQLDNFYQNHRRYVKSRSFAQLQGSYLTPDKLTDCDPIIKNKDLAPQINSFFRSKTNFTASELELPAMPCGLVAKSLFTDTYLFKTLAGVNIPIDEKGIAWQSDIDYKFKNFANGTLVNGVAKNWPDVQWWDMTDEHFIVWMRTAGLPNFRKLYGKITQDIEPGKYNVEIQNLYDVNGFDGNKSFVLSTTNALGGKNYFLAVCYIVVGSLCLIFAVIFLVAFLKKKNIRR